MTRLQIAALTGITFSMSAFSANLTGKISYSGKAPKVEMIKMNADPGCQKANAGANVKKEDIVVNPNNTLANVFVYVKEGVKKENVPPVSSEPAVLDQKGCTYKPHVVGVRVGQPLKILNSDPFMHNVHGLGKANPPFNAAMPSDKTPAIEKKFSKVETMMKVKCDVHGWMNTYVGVLDHPYFAVSDSSGNFTIPGLPPGDYTLEAWHEKLGTKTEKVSVKDGAQTVEIAFGGQKT